MPLFATTYRYAADSVEARNETRPAHREYLGELTASNSLVLSGPYVGGEDGALLVFEAADELAARALTDADPFVIEGLVAEVTVREWQTVSGRLASSV
ncbi:MAG: YciI family protein [Aeromicrobium sp.]